MSDRSLSVDAELVVEGQGRTFRVWSEGDRLVVDAPSLRSLRALDSLQATLPLGAVPPGDRLAESGLTVEVQVRRATVARLGSGVRSNRAGRRLTGVDAAIEWSGVATAAARALG